MNSNTTQPRVKTTQPRVKRLSRIVNLDSDRIRELVYNDLKQVRTPITSQHLKGAEFEYGADHELVIGKIHNRLGLITKKKNPISNEYERGIIHSPFGEVGSLVLIKEVWRIGAYDAIRGLFAIDYQATPEITHTDWVRVSDDPDGSKFRALLKSVKNELSAKNILPNEDGTWSWEAGQSPLSWHTASTMPEWASRFPLVVSKVGVEPDSDNVFSWNFVTDFKVL